MFTVRHATPADVSNIYTLYKKVAVTPFGIARSPEEVTHEYVEGFTRKAALSGIQLVIDNPAGATGIVAEIHCAQFEPKIFKHVLADLTIAVHPDFQGKGIGRMIFTHLLDLIKNDRPDILRVELISRETNLKAISFYESLGFKREGKLEKRIKGEANEFEADIPMGWINPNYKNPS